MTKSQLSALLRGLIPAIRDYIAANQQSIHERLTALEAAERLPGEPGPAGKDGMPGKDGAPGSWVGVRVEQVDERSWRLVGPDGTPVSGVVKSPVVIDRGVYQSGRTYEKGDGATFGGSFWIAQDTTTEKPGDGATKWRLAVKAGREGREGKPGKDGATGPKGERGDPGRNFT